MSACNRHAPNVITTFARRLIESNGLDAAGFRRWLFFPGMLFLSENSWWGDGRPRPFSHEGLDVCLFENRDARRLRLDHRAFIPAADNCRVVSVIDDFIGKTIICTPISAPVSAPDEPAGDRGISDPDGASHPVILYAHVLPANGISTGDAVRRGDLIARIAPADPERTPLPPHFHISLLHAGFLPDPERLDWHRLNRLDRSAFIDPLHALGFSENGMQMVDFDPKAAFHDEYAAVDSRLSGSCTKTP